jgi:hypothetical protein
MAVADARPAPRGQQADEERPRRSRRVHALLLVALAGIAAAQARPLAFFFFQDDYVAFGEIVTNGARTYTWNLLTLQDLTPNWRVFTGLTYLASYRAFGMTALPTHAVMLALHLAVAALLYRAVWRTTGRAWAAFAAALVFGIHPAYAGTFGQIGSVTYTWAAFFLAATLNAVIEAVLARDGRARTAWLAAGALSYAFTIASNESMAIMFPAFGLALLLLDREPDPRRRFVRATVRTLPFAAIGFAAAIGFTACDCTAAEDTFGTANVHRAALIYLGRLAYPIGLEPPSYIDPPHLYGGLALLAVSGALLAAGPAIGRVGVVWMLLAIVPHALIEDHTAQRFVYLATPGFAMAAAGAGVSIEPVLRRAHRLLPAAAGLALLGAVAPWYAWQTHAQTEPYRVATGNWKLLRDELERVFPDVPPGSRVEIIGGPLTHPLDNFFVMPAVGFTIWSPEVTLQTFAPDDPYVATLRASGNPYVAEFRGRTLVPLRLVPDDQPP